MKVNFRNAASRNEWIYKSDGICINGYYEDYHSDDDDYDDDDYDDDEDDLADCPSDYEYPKVTYCFHDLTAIISREPKTKRRDATLKLWFNSIHAYDDMESDDDYGVEGKYSNCTILHYEEYNEYIQLIQDFIPKFDYQLIKGTEYLDDGDTTKHQIIINFHQVNYVEFLFISTLIRYGYEFPSSPCMKDVLILYHILDGKLNIVNCVNVVLGMWGATHGHQTQCIYPHKNGIPELMVRKNILNRLISVNRLEYVFFHLIKRYLCPVNNSNWTYLVVDLEEFAKTQSQRMSMYLNFINKWRSVSTV